MREEGQADNASGSCGFPERSDPPGNYLPCEGAPKPPNPDALAAVTRTKDKCVGPPARSVRRAGGIYHAKNW
jgi:hypothetical protein